MNAVSEDIKDYIIANNTNFILGSNLFIGFMPTNPDNCTVLLDTGGMSPQLTMNREEVYEYPALQIIARDRYYRTGFAKLETLKTLLHGQSTTINNTFYSLIRCANGPTAIGVDENKRFLFSLNFLIQRR